MQKSDRFRQSMFGNTWLVKESAGRPNDMEPCDLKLNVFECSAGFLVSPDFTLLPKHALREHGPECPFAGTLVCAKLPPKLCLHVRTEIDRNFFAFIPSSAALLAGLAGHIVPAKPSPPTTDSARME